MPNLRFAHGQQTDCTSEHIPAMPLARSSEVITLPTQESVADMLRAACQIAYEQDSVFTIFDTLQDALIIADSMLPDDRGDDDPPYKELRLGGTF